MARFNKRFVKIMVPFTILSAGVLPGSCTLQFRDALIAATADFTAATFVDLLSGILNVAG